MAAATGTYPSQAIRALLDSGAVMLSGPQSLRDKLIQPSSLDLTLSEEAYQLPGSVLPRRDETVRDIVKQLARRTLDLSKPTLLDRGKVYLIRLAAGFKLPHNVAAYTNNKSSTGRIDLATRCVCDRSPRYDKIPEGYTGEVWLEVTPKSFDVVVAAGISLNQAIFYAERRILRSVEMARLYMAPDGSDGTAEAQGGYSPLYATQRRGPLLFDKHGYGIAPQDVIVEDGLLMTLDFEQDGVGFKARKTFEPVDLTAPPGTHDAEEFFEKLEKPRNGSLWLERGQFYILSTWEYIRVPPEYAVEMLPFDTSAGEFRAHYAGFFDPGFGYGLAGEELGTPAVLEVRPYDDDLIIRHRQPICRMAYEVLSAKPDRLYHASIGSNYATQRGPRLSKFFKG